MYANQIRYACARQILRTNRVARALRRNHDNVNICRRYDLLEVNVEAMRKPPAHCPA